MIYQSGYLTIKGHDERFGIYRLGFPNREVEEGFIRFLLPYYANVNKVESPFEILKFVREVRAGDFESGWATLRFAGAQRMPAVDRRGEKACDFDGAR